MGRHRRQGQTPNATFARFAGYDVLGQAPTWDEETRRVVLSRLDRPAPLRFFTSHQEPTARALVDRLLAQDREPRVPVLEVIDLRLLRRDGDGYRHHDMPEDPEVWSRSVDALDDEARERTGRRFAELAPEHQRHLLRGIQQAPGEWRGLPAAKLFALWMRYACEAFYAHPWAWNEIGFGGPAYPRGYKNLGLGRRENFEKPERDARDPVPWARRVEAAQESGPEREPEEAR